MLPARHASVTLPAPMPLPAILYEDEAILAFDKPSGMLVAPDRART